MNRGVVLLVLWVGGIALCAAVSNVGTWASKDTHPDCQEAPLNATNRCPLVVDTARTVGSGLLFGGLLIVPASTAFIFTKQEARL